MLPSMALWKMATWMFTYHQQDGKAMLCCSVGVLTLSACQWFKICIFNSADLKKDHSIRFCFFVSINTLPLLLSSLLTYCTVAFRSVFHICRFSAYHKISCFEVFFNSESEEQFSEVAPEPLWCECDLFMYPHSQWTLPHGGLFLTVHPPPPPHPKNKYSNFCVVFWPFYISIKKKVKKKTTSV